MKPTSSRVKIMIDTSNAKIWIQTHKIAYEEDHLCVCEREREIPVFGPLHAGRKKQGTADRLQRQSCK